MKNSKRKKPQIPRIPQIPQQLRTRAMVIGVAKGRGIEKCVWQAFVNVSHIAHRSREMITYADFSRAVIIGLDPYWIMLNKKIRSA